MNGTPQVADYLRILPEIVLSVFGMAVMLLDPLLEERRRAKVLGGVGLVGALVALVSTFCMAKQRGPAFWNMVQVDSFSVFFHFLVIAITVVVVLSSYEYMEVQKIRAGEYYALMLFGAVGMCLMSSAVELVLIFIALEISSISTYILAGFRRRAAISSESSVKYFLLGSFATAFFLYGVALMFGATGSTSIAVVSTRLQAEPTVRYSPTPPSRSCLLDSDSKWPLLPSTSGRLTFTRAHLRQWSDSCPPAPRPLCSRSCCALFSKPTRPEHCGLSGQRLRCP
jgi:NADH-quinone oxidoreductase subunit N